ncbi:LysM peptidoglycan-binding domain-containing protein, partial [Rossellomorea marisflavi]|uniref:LysM peptidoglycan-binding domain-containing protein n=1 Tax=Rossellomorea marisflavi TaxID=189381 RepID=UPI0034584A70
PTSTYTVKSGDNLGSIALKFDMTLAEIKSLNNISDPDKLQIGQVLKVYSTGSDSGGGSTRPTSTYTVKSGDNLGSIALKFDMTLAEIKSLNNISDPDKLQIGQVLKVYSTGSGSGGGSTRPTSTYTVKSGDNLGSIALKFDMTLAEIKSLNNISDPDKLQIGQVLKVYKNDSNSGDTGSGGSTPKTTTYTVKSGDNLGSIAQRFGMSLSQIQSLNNISNPDKIQVGQVLKVYDNGNGSGGETNPGTGDIGDGNAKVTRVTESQLNELGWSSKYLSDAIIQDLNNCLELFNITTRSRICHFLSQCSVESLAGIYAEEIDDGWRYEGSTTLGNTQPGDGPKFKGGGYIQTTGRYNYTQFANYIGDPEVVNQGVTYLAAKYPWSSAGFWWYNNGMNALCDNNASVRTVTIRVNGAIRETTHLDWREMYYNRAIQIF